MVCINKEQNATAPEETERLTSTAMPAQEMLSEILQTPGYTLTRVSEEVGISRQALSRIYHKCCAAIHVRSFNKILSLYCYIKLNINSNKAIK
jgi:hypothetical protein